MLRLNIIANNDPNTETTINISIPPKTDVTKSYENIDKYFKRTYPNVTHWRYAAGRQDDNYNAIKTPMQQACITMLRDWGYSGKDYFDVLRSNIEAIEITDLTSNQIYQINLPEHIVTVMEAAIFLKKNFVPKITSPKFTAWKQRGYVDQFVDGLQFTTELCSNEKILITLPKQFQTIDDSINFIYENCVEYKNITLRKGISHKKGI